MSNWLGSQSKNWTRCKLKHSPNGVKSTAFLSHLSSTSLPLSSQYSLCLSHLSSTSLSHLNRPAQHSPFLCLPTSPWVSSLTSWSCLSPSKVSSPPLAIFVTADLPFVGPRSLCEPCAACTVWVSSPLIVCVCVWLRCWLMRFGFEFGALVIGGHWADHTLWMWGFCFCWVALQD